MFREEWSEVPFMYFIIECSGTVFFVDYGAGGADVAAAAAAAVVLLRLDLRRHISYLQTGFLPFVGFLKVTFIS